MMTAPSSFEKPTQRHTCGDSLALTHFKHGDIAAVFQLYHHFRKGLIVQILSVAFAILTIGSVCNLCYGSASKIDPQISQTANTNSQYVTLSTTVVDLSPDAAALCERRRLEPCAACAAEIVEPC
jgi:hypothetical protein